MSDSSSLLSVRVFRVFRGPSFFLSTLHSPLPTLSVPRGDAPFFSSYCHHRTGGRGFGGYRCVVARLWAKSRSMASLKAGRSLGWRLVTQLPSSPPLPDPTRCRPHSGCRLGSYGNSSTCGHAPGRRRPIPSWAWQIAAIGLPASCIARKKDCTSGTMRRASLFTPPGNWTPSKSSALTSLIVRSTVILIDFVSCRNP